MKKDSEIFIRHILENIEKIEKHTKEVEKKKFFEKEEIQDLVIRKLEIIGEASKNLPKEFRNHHKEVEWNKIGGLRDKLIHHYFGVDLDLIFDIVKKDLPELKKKVKDILKEIEESKKT
ncbi:MAG: hypothetical protein COY38_00690 [Candidatus Aenigmarchaeota archaeon CG_4_10_14_0_8_um_filter_37_24]|nr:DUF86 domain-containing protein [Candidatus Aenigmarchaeota archaeon]OIN86226.1 MAG: hypothetical protein AUJ50_04085 [Candidatus Aenigmarchaeota archaeon CG1_02_38_14]PIV69296.1 MAG: hypothetical protein COS07_01250 [Candidatus Aenigmarchaeota archaeon CG01_land_8_20_14_3_00_37_9]PIW41349.1 MAG: hypothetical protein COW21_02465 [Candidatus Aenigmarchaeota archaeon CG15_BIG_FIL_POST_REV_8_21_14_020_37_27]PIX50679.1 MAG: hypothetical protein COZ52_02730 [Candidatus Aenigmarchaeota archaeon CG